MNKRERVDAALRGAEVDHVPISFWGHSYVREWSAEGLAEAMLENYHAGDWDYMKVNPRARLQGCRAFEQLHLGVDHRDRRQFTSNDQRLPARDLVCLNPGEVDGDTGPSYSRFFCFAMRL